MFVVSVPLCCQRGKYVKGLQSKSCAFDCAYRVCLWQGGWPAKLGQRFNQLIPLSPLSIPPFDCLVSTIWQAKADETHHNIDGWMYLYNTCMLWNVSVWWFSKKHSWIQKEAEVPGPGFACLVLDGRAEEPARPLEGDQYEGGEISQSWQFHNWFAQKSVAALQK